MSEEKSKYEIMCEKVDELGHIYPMNDVGHARRFTVLNTGSLLRQKETGTWVKWEEGKWTVDADGALFNGMRKVERDLTKDAENLGTVLEKYIKFRKDDGKDVKDDPREAKLVALHKSTLVGVEYLMSDRGVSAVQRQVVAMGELNVEVDEFDSKGMFIGVENGIVDIRTGKLVEATPDYLVSKTISTSFDPNATCPNWGKTISNAMMGDAEMIKFIQRCIGQCFVGSQKDKLMIWIGSGANLKTTVAGVVQKLLGDYGTMTDSKMIMGNDSKKEYYLARLSGKRMVVMNESKVEAKMATDLVKLMLDAEFIPARDPGGKPFNVKPLFTPVLTTNHFPMIGADPAVWRRLMVVRWGYKVPEAERNTRYAEQFLYGEFSGILNWCLEGARMYLEEGLNPPQSVIDATMEEAKEQNDMENFIEQEMIKTDENDFVECQAFMRAYHEYLANEGSTGRPKVKTINDELRMMGYTIKPVRAAGNRACVMAIRLKTIHDELKQDVERRKEERGFSIAK